MAEEKSGWFGRIKAGLARTTQTLSRGIDTVFGGRKPDAAALQELEDLLITADLGVTTAHELAQAIGKERFEGDATPAQVREALARDIETILAPVARPLALTRKPHVVLVAGVNGSGKTTTIAKLAHYYRAQGLSVLLAAGDTFRAAAIEQLRIWGERVGAPVIARAPGSDAASLAYEALERAKAENVDILFIDTAGRLQNRKELMAELEKMVRVLKKLDADAPHDCLLVLDATVGQNAHAQVETFKQMIGITGLVVTKLDGSAKGGVIVALARRFGLPVHAIGVGEKADDLRPFAAGDFARALVGLDA
jgi:fused signal recognition particle receptor